MATRRTASRAQRRYFLNPPQTSAPLSCSAVVFSQVASQSGPLPFGAVRVVSQVSSFAPWHPLVPGPGLDPAPPSAGHSTYSFATFVYNPTVVKVPDPPTVCTAAAVQDQTERHCRGCAATTIDSAASATIPVPAAAFLAGEFWPTRRLLTLELLFTCSQPRQCVTSRLARVLPTEQRIAVLTPLLPSRQVATLISSGSEPRAYQVGDRVWGRYCNGRWYPARVAGAQGDGRYMLDWVDGDSQDRIKGPEEVSLLQCLPQWPLSEALGLSWALSCLVAVDVQSLVWDQF